MYIVSWIKKCIFLYYIDSKIKISTYIYSYICFFQYIFSKNDKKD